MENEMQQASEFTLDRLMARLTAAIEQLERALPRISVTASEAVGPIVAMVESSREAELAQKLADAERTIAALRASASTHSSEGRKTLPVSLLAKQEGGITDSSALDAALGSLSMEQRIAVKSQRLRAGLV
jgi:nitrate reductase NapAB chaperone NapD